MLNNSYSTKNIIAIAIPIMLGNLAQTLITFVDTAFLGHVGSIELGASMMAGLYYYVFSTLAWGFAVGIQIVIARRLGEKNYARIGTIFEHGLLVVLLLSILLFTLLHFCTDTLLSSIIESDAIRQSAMEYMKYRHYGIIFVCFNFLYRSLYVGLSNTKIITYTTLLMALVNILFDYLFIFGNWGFPQLGVGGAAIASVMAEFSALVFFTLYTFIKLPTKEYGIFTFQNFDLSLLSSIVKISLPTMLQRLISFGSWFVFFVMLEQTGELAIAISGIVRSIYMLIMVPIFALAATANTLTSRLIGEGHSQDVMVLNKKIIKLSIIFIVGLIILVALFPQQMASIYTDDIGLAQATVPVLYVICVGAIAMCVANIFFEAVSGTGNTLAAMLMESVILVVYIVYIYLVTKAFPMPIEVVWCTELVYGIGLSVISFLYIKYAKWQKKII